ncbi:MAG: YdcF family protein, partial [Rhodospirillales bacterium]|nr:YdcF family protein [Rhodospirillales bacterium]
MNDPAVRLRSTMENAPAPRRVVVVTGMSGAGKSSALKALEDAGYEAVDNLPLSLLASLVRPEDAAGRPIAIGVDTRTRDFGVGSFLAAHERLRAEANFEPRLLFLDCEDEVLRRRFTETRRRHPLAADRPVTDGIQAERALVQSLRERADLVLDTSTLTQADLKRLVHGGPRFDCCADLGRTAANTHGNAAETAAWVRGHHYRRLVIVTASYHMPRALREFAAEMPGVMLQPYPVEPDGID